MQLENLVVDALDPRGVGRFWEALVGAETLTDDEAGFETRLTVEGGLVLDLCFQPVPEPAAAPPRLRVHLLDGRAPSTDPEGNPCAPVADPSAYADTGPIAALSLDSADPVRDAAFWAWLTGWVPVGDTSLRHPSLRGPVLELHLETTPKRTKNRMHLDVRLEAGEDADEVAAAIAAHGGREEHPGWGDLPWRHYVDPSGNELCVLRVSHG